MEIRMPSTGLFAGQEPEHCNLQIFSWFTALLNSKN